MSKTKDSAKANGSQPFAEATCSVAALRAELDTIIELAEWGIANEQLGGNVCKEEHWKGQRFAATQIKQWLEAQPQND